MSLLVAGRCALVPAGRCLIGGPRSVSRRQFFSASPNGTWENKDTATNSRHSMTTRRSNEKRGRMDQHGEIKVFWLILSIEKQKKQEKRFRRCAGLLQASRGGCPGPPPRGWRGDASAQGWSCVPQSVAEREARECPERARRDIIGELPGTPRIAAGSTATTCEAALSRCQPAQRVRSRLREWRAPGGRPQRRGSAGRSGGREEKAGRRFCCRPATAVDPRGAEHAAETAASDAAA